MEAIMTTYTEQQTFEIAKAIYDTHKLLQVCYTIRAHSALDQQHNLMHCVLNEFAQSEDASFRKKTEGSNGQRIITPLLLEKIMFEAHGPLINETLASLSKYQEVPAVKQITDNLYQLMPLLKTEEVKKTS